MENKENIEKEHITLSEALDIFFNDEEVERVNYQEIANLQLQ